MRLDDHLHMPDGGPADMIDLFALLIVTGMGIFGWLRGTVSMALWAGGLLGGYAAALLFFRPIGSFVAGASGLPEIATYPLAGMIVLFAVSSAVNWQARRLRRERAFKIENGWDPPAWDAPGGLALGAAYGAGLALILVWAGASLAGLWGEGRLDSVRTSTTGRASTAVIQRAVAVGARMLVGDPFIARGLGHVVADPASATEALGSVISDARVRELIRSGAIQQAVDDDNPEALARHPSLVALSRDEAFVSALREFGVLPRGPGRASPGEVAEAITREAGPALRSVEALRRDEEIRGILTGPAFQDALERGDYLSLARDEGVRRIFQRVVEELRGGG